MDERPFMNKTAQPEEAALQAALGGSQLFYERLLALADGYSREWGFTKSGGWLLKLFDRKKALLYLIPLNGAFKISLTLREAERESLLQDQELASLHESLLASKKYVEGFALQFEVREADGFRAAELLIGKLIALRG
jgi:hypothetical protein